MLYDIESIRIDGQDYDVQWLDLPPIPPQDIANVDFQRQVIIIYKTHEQNDLNSLLHEIAHIINRNRLGDMLNEAQISSIGCSLTQLISDNTAEIMTMASIGLEDDDSGESELEL